MIARTFSAEIEGITAKRIEIEVDINVGLHSFTIVGLADKALSEAKERVNAALKNSSMKPPNRENRKITVNLAPADIKKAGSQYDVAIALGYLLATKQMREFRTDDKLFIGELSLQGGIRPVRGCLNAVEMATRNGFATVFLPADNAPEAEIARGISIIPVSSLAQLIRHLEGTEHVPPIVPVSHETLFARAGAPPPVALSDIRGQHHAKRALAVAAAGGHNILLFGPPGSGKSMLAQAMVSLLPPMTADEIAEVTKIYSAAGLTAGGVIATRPFRAPHHTASSVAIVGGGTVPRPGEVTLAHRGVLFLDEFPEFKHDVLESLRQPMESGTITVARINGTLTFPAQFTLLAAMNPCPCGFSTDPEKECVCSPYQVVKYRKRISGPLTDRIDLQIHVARIPTAELAVDHRIQGATDSSAAAHGAVMRAIAIQADRFRGLPAAPVSGFGTLTTNGFSAGWRITTSRNAEMTSRMCEERAAIRPDAKALLLSAVERFKLSPRAYFRIIKTARTIADLEEAAEIKTPHMAEAIGYRVRE
ncbi:MAG: YifB family Mg chelatase-like AAA ATPase [Candidatus Liptonbacteria bacterium]|nr:YifB family Mg chelatase-like AAA ATPase [Candidatus Liptonbacteria bacterium]